MCSGYSQKNGHEGWQVRGQLKLHLQKEYEEHFLGRPKTPLPLEGTQEKNPASCSQSITWRWRGRGREWIILGFYLKEGKEGPTPQTSPETDVLEGQAMGGQVDRRKLDEGSPRAGRHSPKHVRNLQGCKNAEHTRQLCPNTCYEGTRSYRLLASRWHPWMTESPTS